MSECRYIISCNSLMYNSFTMSNGTDRGINNFIANVPIVQIFLKVKAQVFYVVTPASAARDG